MSEVVTGNGAIHARVVDVSEFGHVNIRDLLDKLADLPEGKALRFEVPSDKTKHQITQAIYARALRLGIAVSYRYDGEEIILWRRTRKRRVRTNLVSPIKQRNQEIVKALEAIGSYSEVARQFGLTRQRIEQIYVRDEATKFSHLPWGAGRITAQLEFLKPYIEAAASPPKCLTCGELLILTSEKVKVIGPVCTRCRRARCVLASIKGRLHAHLQNQTKTVGQSRNTAAYLIRKHGVKPEDLRFV